MMTRALSELTLEELWQLFPIIIEEHNNHYLEWYTHSKQEILECIKETNCKRINHIGSTTVKGLLAKPTVDILLEIAETTDIDLLEVRLIKGGWLLMNSTKTPSVDYVFNKGYTECGFADKVFHLHVRNYGDWDELYFRDYLIENEDIAKQYGDLKLELVKSYKNDRDAYTNAKSDFIKSNTKKARILYGDRYK